MSNLSREYLIILRLPIDGSRAHANNDAPEPNNIPNLWAQQYFVSVINDCQSTVARAVDVNYSLGILLANKNARPGWSGYKFSYRA